MAFVSYLYVVFLYLHLKHDKVRKMKKILFIALAAMCVATITAQKYNLHDIVGGKFNAKGVAAMVSSADGMHYYKADALGTAVIKYSYSKDEPMDTLFNTRNARNCTFDTFEGFLVSNDEN